VKVPVPEDVWYRRRLADPPACPRVVIDTDAANEIDDQFALAWALLAPERLRVEAVYAAPFSFAHRRRDLGRELADPRPFDPPGEGMRRSFDEIVRVFGRCGVPSTGRVLAGATDYLGAPATPQDSAAARDLVARAMTTPEDECLYVLAMGCVTNIASALLLEPLIADRLVVVWTSGYPSHAPHVNHSFNLEQDLAASMHLLDCGVPLVYLPGFHVGAQLRLSLPEIERWVRGQGAIGDYLHHLYTHNPLWELQGIDSFFAHSWVIWDLICVAWLLEPTWVPTAWMRTPGLAPDKRWIASDASRPLMREAHAVRRDAIFGDFFRTLARNA
jgi:inosine-uridine nucleoside N-ribohydrolase